MKRIIYLVLAVVVCSCSGQKFNVSGDVPRLKVGDSLELVAYSDRSAVIATAVVTEDDRLEISGSVPTETFAVLLCNKNRVLTPLFLESGNIKLEVDDNRRFVVSGTRYNEALTKFNGELRVFENEFNSIDRTLDADQIAQLRDSIYSEYAYFVEQNVQNNLDNIFGAYVFVSEQYGSIDATKSKEVINSFSRKMRANESVAATLVEVESILGTEVGNPYIDVTLKDSEGQEISVSSLLADGNYVLIDFWATWCGPCCAELPHLKEAYELFGDKNFKIYGISVDKEYPDWADFVVNEKLTWINVIETEERLAASAYGLRTIPTNFLISPDGIIVAKNLRGENVIETIGQFVE